MTLIDYHHGKMGNPLSFTIGFPMISSWAPSPKDWGTGLVAQPKVFFLGEKNSEKAKVLAKKEGATYRPLLFRPMLPAFSGKLWKITRQIWHLDGCENRPWPGRIRKPLTLYVRKRSDMDHCMRNEGSSLLLLGTQEISWIPEISLDLSNFRHNLWYHFSIGWSPELFQHRATARCAILVFSSFRQKLRRQLNKVGENHRSNGKSAVQICSDLEFHPKKRPPAKNWELELGSR